MGVGGSTSSAALLDVVVCRAAGGRNLGAGVAGGTALDVARLAGLESSVLDGSLSDDRGRKSESDGRDQGEDGEKLHGDGFFGAEARGSEGRLVVERKTELAGLADSFSKGCSRPLCC